jgi:hypothetical protein
MDFCILKTNFLGEILMPNFQSFWNFLVSKLIYSINTYYVFYILDTLVVDKKIINGKV